MHVVETFEHAGRTVKIVIDPEPYNPRKEYDHLTVIAHWHRRADVGDVRIEHATEKKMRAQLKEKGDEILAIKPLYLYEHSGMTVSTSPFACAFDSGQVGWIYVLLSRIREVLTGTFMNVSREELDAILDGLLEADVKTLDHYFQGNVYGFIVEGLDGEELSSVWGFYGLELTRGEARDAAEHAEDPAVAHQAAELAERATYAQC